MCRYFEKERELLEARREAHRERERTYLNTLDKEDFQKEIMIRILFALRDLTGYR